MAALNNLTTSTYMSRLPTVLNGIKEEESPLPSLSSTDINQQYSDNNKASEEAARNAAFSRTSNPMNDSSLFKEYQKNKAQIIQQLEEQDKKRDELVKQLKCELLKFSGYFLL